jgi:FKBP-type peptidyl-prolyl cis-trans isomerase 2
MPKAQEGDLVTVVYQGLLEDGSVFDSSADDDPLVFVLGEDKVLPGFEKAVLGMEVGEQKTIRIPPEEGFGVHQKQLVDEFAVNTLPAGLNLEIGTQLEVTAEDGTRFQAVITDLQTDRVTLDANHPLAGQTLIFQLELLAIDRPTIN